MCAEQRKPVQQAFCGISSFMPLAWRALPCAWLSTSFAIMLQRLGPFASLPSTVM